VATASYTTVTITSKAHADVIYNVMLTQLSCTIALCVLYVLNSGHGSLWRVEALRGNAADGKRYADATQRALVGSEIGFRSEMVLLVTLITLMKYVVCAYSTCTASKDVLKAAAFG
jgi:hypothetical protein